MWHPLTKLIKRFVANIQFLKITKETRNHTSEWKSRNKKFNQSKNGKRTCVAVKDKSQHKKKINKADIYLYIIKPINARISENTRHIHMVYIHTYTYTQVSISAWLLYVNSLSCRFLPLYTPCDTSINANWIKFVEHGKKKKTHA